MYNMEQQESKYVWSVTGSRAQVCLVTFIFC
jgi:hypothetical protein